MAIVQALLALLSRQLGRLLNTAFGWATVLLFGKVPHKRQLYLSAMAASSVLWIVVLVGIAFPKAGVFLLSFVPLPDWVDQGLVRWIMFGLTIAIPALVGVISLFVLDPSDRPRGFSAKCKAVLKGYPYTIGLALTFLLMLVVAPIMKIRDLARRWTSTHVPLVIEPQDYSKVVDEIQRVMRDHNVKATREQASWLVRWPTKVFTFFASGANDDLVADNLAVLRAPNQEIMLHPSDLVISGREKDVTRTHAIMTEHLSFTDAYLTWSKESQQIEDRLDAVWRGIKTESFSMAESLEVVRDIQNQLTKLSISYEEWEILFRMRVLVEREILIRSLAPAGQDESELSIPVEQRLKGTNRRTSIFKLAACGIALLTFLRSSKANRLTLSI